MALPLLLLTCGVEGTGLLISDGQEAQLGAQVHDEVITEYPLLNDATVQAWVEDLGSRLAAASVSERSGVTYRFHVLEDDELINAFAAPGGYIYVTTGLILAADTEAEVAGVIGHEVGHVAHRHGVAKVERAAAAGLIGDFVFGDGSFADEAVQYATAFVLSTDYSQDQETDADLLGVRFTYDAGISPLGLVDFFNRLAAMQGETFLPDWMSSHPQPAARATRTSQEIQSIHPGFDSGTPGFAVDVTGQFSQIQSLLANR